MKARISVHFEIRCIKSQQFLDSYELKTYSRIFNLLNINRVRARFGYGKIKLIFVN